MNFVQPIRDLEIVKAVADHLKGINERNYIMFLLGIYSGLRISDILKLRVKDVQGEYINIMEKKTGKCRRFKINSVLKKEVLEYVLDKEQDDYLIQSRNGRNKPICRVRAYQILKDVALEFNIDSFGTHSLRKTFGYQYYTQSNGDIATLQKIYNHSDPSYTLRYIGIVQDTIDSAIESIKIL